MEFEWDPIKAETNYRTHNVRFSEALAVFEDENALTITDDESDPWEQRFISIGVGVRGRVLVVVFSYRGSKVRIISVRVAEAHERRQYEGAL